MTTRKYEARFTGKDNAGLRKAIRDSVSGHRCGNANAAAVMSLARTVALTAGGLATLEQVAADYRAVCESSRTCDCDACYAGNLQLLGANG